MNSDNNQLIEKIRSMVKSKLNEEFGQPTNLKDAYDYVLSLFYDGYYEDMAEQFMNIEKPMRFLNYVKTILNPNIYTQFLERLVINLV